MAMRQPELTCAGCQKRPSVPQPQLLASATDSGTIVLVFVPDSSPIEVQVTGSVSKGLIQLLLKSVQQLTGSKVASQFVQPKNPDILATLHKKLRALQDVQQDGWLHLQSHVRLHTVPGLLVLVAEGPDAASGSLSRSRAPRCEVHVPPQSSAAQSWSSPSCCRIPFINIAAVQARYPGCAPRPSVH